MIFLRYDKNSSNYRLYNPQKRKITITCNVLFDEQQYAFFHEDEKIPVLFQFKDDYDQNPTSQIESESNIQEDETITEEYEPNLVNDRPIRKVKLPERFRDFDVEVHLVELDMPNTYHEAVSCKNAEKWKDAIQEGG